MSESPNISIYLNRHALYHALVGVTYVQKHFILFASFSAKKEIETLIKRYVIHNLHLRLYLPHVLLLVQANQIVLLVLHRLAILSWNSIVSAAKYLFMQDYPASKLSRALWWRGRKTTSRTTSLQLLLWNLNSTSNSPVAPRQISCQISANQRKAEMSGSVKKHWKTHTKGNDIITNVISTNQHFSLLFRCRYSNSRDVVASSPSFSRSAARAPQRACHRLMEYPPLSYLA